MVNFLQLEVEEIKHYIKILILWWQKHLQKIVDLVILCVCDDFVINVRKWCSIFFFFFKVVCFILKTFRSCLLTSVYELFMIGGEKMLYASSVYCFLNVPLPQWLLNTPNYNILIGQQCCSFVVGLALLHVDNTAVQVDILIFHCLHLYLAFPSLCSLQLMVMNNMKPK